MTDSDNDNNLPMDDTLARGRVVTERRYRGLSARKAADLGQISNTAWSRWERGQAELTGTIRHAVARAFSWPNDWPENLPPEPTGGGYATTLEGLSAELGQVAASVDALGEQLQRLGARQLTISRDLTLLVELVTQCVEHLGLHAVVPTGR